MRDRRRLGWLLPALAVAVACSGETASAAEVKLDEFSVDVSADRFVAGTVELEVLNGGEFPHTLVISTREGSVVTATGLIQPGETTRLSVDLPAGSYLFTCRIVTQLDSGELIDHYQEGMVARVGSIGS
jgi:hypothetical protein